MILRGIQAACAPIARAVRCVDPERAQRRLLADLAKRASATAYGRHYGVSDADSFRSALPLVRYEDLEPWISRQIAENGPVLTSSPVQFYEKTSGSSGAQKLIPYTSALLRSFARMLVAWAHDVLANGPHLTTGQLYFSISPSFTPRERTAHGVPIGLADDADYLGPWLKRLLSPFFVVPEGAAQATSSEAFKGRVASALLGARRLEIVSVWNPSFFNVLLDWIEEHHGKVDWATVWPELKLVSCWASAGAEPLARALQKRLPHVTVQGKGLLATEAPLTIPNIAAGGYLPLADEVFYELVDSRGGIHLLHEADIGSTYELVISQKGGLSRYRIGDRVTVTHRFGNMPCLEFVGRGDDTSDLVGEKLTDAFVLDTLRSLDLGGAFFHSLVPARYPREHYVLVVDRAPSVTAAQLDAALSRAHHYGLARSLGQLDAARIVVVPRIEDALREHHARRGMKWGDRKHRVLETVPGDELLREIVAA
ncbi:MAG TPA: GH3 auxin-responsive promoter family protein [Labilithrix sp.]|nr:GH3 auxin-responsive promoter family protein [Labilithrix sp.]